MSVTASAAQSGWPHSGATAWPRPLLVLGLVVAADFLLFDQPAGIAWFIMATLLAAAIVAVHPLTASEQALTRKIAIPAATLLPLIENVSPVSVVVALIGLAILALSLARRLRDGMAAIARQIVGFAFLAPFRLMADLLRLRGMRRRLGGGTMQLTGLLAWVVAIVFGALFIALFGIANPVIEDWLSRIDVLAWLAEIDFARLLFWLVVTCGSWAYLRPRLPRGWRRGAAASAAQPKTPTALADALFGRAALLRALIVFNAIFAVQTVLDAAYLWGGVALPDGLSYASYAHRGAYALIVTALLAAAFVLAAMRPGSVTSADRLIRGLVYLWVAQNVWLVLSSILRLDLYVDIYSLTYWRIAAFLWMGLVAVGLVLIIGRIALEKSNEWLLSANLLTLSALIYACCFINFAALIASYNVDHSREMTGKGLPIDQTYLRELGASAFPAIDRLIARAWAGELCASYDQEAGAPLCLQEARARDEAAFREAAGNWRNLGFRNWRQMRYLDGRRAVLSTDPRSGTPPGAGPATTPQAPAGPQQ